MERDTLGAILVGFKILTMSTRVGVRDFGARSSSYQAREKIVRRTRMKR